MKTLLWILIGGGIFFSLPSTMYLAVFKGIFGRSKLQGRDLAVWCRGIAPLEKAYRNAMQQFNALHFTEVTVKASDGKRLNGAYLNLHRDKLMILAHGYRTPPEINFAPQICDFLAQGYDILLIDHRAHGKSGGCFGSMGYLEGQDLLKWVEWAEYEKIAVYGMSMGCAAVGHACGKLTGGKVRALIMDCGFSNFYDELNYKCDLWGMPKTGFAPAENLLAKLILRVDLRENTVSSLKECTTPVFFLHGALDDEVPLKEMELQYEACACEKECLVVENAPHALAYALGGEDAKRKLADFLKKHVDGDEACE